MTNYVLAVQVISATASPEISNNAIACTIKLKEFTMYLEWSKIGKMHLNLVEVCLYAFYNSCCQS